MFRALGRPLRRPLPSFTRPVNCPASSATCVKVLSHLREIHYGTLPNGFRTACDYVPGYAFSTVGVWIDAGSRFETAENNGVAHFLEHLNFKGTKNFDRKTIEKTFEYLGAHFNAYTSRDRTAYYIKVFNSDVDVTLRLLADVLQNGLYMPRDVENERPTILAEMQEVEELVEEVIMDQLHAVAFDPTVSGLPFTILGPSENIAKTINREQVQQFVRTHYTGPRMMLVSSGGIAPDALHAYADKYFSTLPSHSARPHVTSRYIGGHSILWNQEMLTTHTAWAFPTCGAQHPDSIPLQLVHNLVGRFSNDAPDMFRHQRFNTTRRHRPDLELIRPFYTPYEDTGVLGYTIVTSPPTAGGLDSLSREDQAAARDSQSVILEDILEPLYRMCHKPPTEQLLSDAKADFKAGRLISIDSTTNTCEDLGRQMVHFGRRVEPKEFLASIDAVTPAMITDVLQRYLAPVRPSLSVIGAPDTAPSLDVADGVKYRAM